VDEHAQTAAAAAVTVRFRPAFDFAAIVVIVYVASWRGGCGKNEEAGWAYVLKRT